MKRIGAAVVVWLSMCGTALVARAQQPSPTAVDSVVPIVGHLNGNGGSQFRSDLKLYNPYTTVLTGRLVFTPRGRSASAYDPWIPFSLEPSEVAFFEDVFDFAYPGGNGAARLVVVVDNPYGPEPIVDSSTYTATSDGGELGQSPTVFARTQYYGLGIKLVGILGKETERTNLFVMTGPSDVVIRWQYRDSYGDASQSILRLYGRNSTFQFGASDLLGFPPAPNASLEAAIELGSARLASSPVNNITNQGRWVDFKKVQ